MHFKLVYIIILSNLVFSQSFFNRVFPTELYLGDARSMAIGNSQISTAENSGLILSNPSRMSHVNKGWNIDFGVMFNALSERRSFNYLDTFDEFLSETDYVFNQNNSLDCSIGAIYNNSELFTFGFSYRPLASFEYNYEEEVRAAVHQYNIEPWIKDPIIGYHIFNTSGKLFVRSFGFSINLNNSNNLSSTSFGFGFNQIESNTIKDEIKVNILDSSFGTNNLASLTQMEGAYSMVNNNDDYYTFGIEKKFPNRLVLTFSYEKDIDLYSKEDITNLSWSSMAGLPQYLEFDDTNNLSYLITGAEYHKPAKYQLGFTYYPRSNINMLLVFEFGNKYWDFNLAGFDNNINEYRIGFEYAPNDSYPIRAGLVYSESEFDVIDPKTTLTLGTGLKIGGVEFDLAMNYSMLSYKYIDIFPIEEDYYDSSCDVVICDKVTESNLSFLTTIKIGF